MSCTWPGTDIQYVAYHDTEWGVPETDSRALFEKLILDGFQAGLSWITILRKRDNFRSAFDDFEPEIIARYTEKDIQRCLNDAGIIRHRGKIEATIGNAQAFLNLHDAGQEFNDFCWQFVDGKPLINTFKTTQEIPAQTDASRDLSKALKQAGFKFCGPVIVYAFMQAVGMVNDHLIDCPQHGKCKSLAENF
ncbi:MAG: DNA-3-methyladenine glycosylase [Alphaproteobacteria bacterium TMED110]|nr:DNA-3-methyladenine glycosylase I [Hyphomicrobiales bacterium]OUV50003.1 MAG: DNA-3-methyladenine glycosylase [Alphaproteobacteria bacterium TMED110]